MPPRLSSFGSALIDWPTLARHYRGVFVRESQVTPNRRPARAGHNKSLHLRACEPLPLSTLLSFAWTAITIEVDNVFKEALAMAIGFLERRRIATVAPDGRVRIVKLTPAGRRAKAAYNTIVWETEAKWRSRLGNARVLRLRHALEHVVAGKAGEALLAEAIAAPQAAGAQRSKNPIPCLGSRWSFTAEAIRMDREFGNGRRSSDF
jgi:hypothetical protein